MVKAYQYNFIGFHLVLKICLMTFDLNNFSKCSCDREKPIYKNGECQSIYCTESEFRSNICSIENDIIKEQWLNNFIVFNEYNYRFTNKIINDEGDFILITSPMYSGIRLFYVLKKNGSFYFKNDDNQEISTKKIEVKDGDSISIRSYSQVFLIRAKNNSLLNTNKQFLVSISSFLGYFELYDLEDDNVLVSKLPTQNFTDHIIATMRDSIIELPNNEYLYTYIGQKEAEFLLYLQKYSFYDIDINQENINEKVKKETIEKNIWFAVMLSSFSLDENTFVLFYYDNRRDMRIELLDENLNNKNFKIVDNANVTDDLIGLFFKSIYFSENIGIFGYYINDQNSYPKILIEKIELYNFTDLFHFDLNDIIEGKEQFNTQPLLNDLIKINDKRFSLISSSRDKLVLYIILFDLYNNQQNIKIRLYKIDIYNLYNYKIFSDISCIMFNNYLTLSMSVCNSLKCENEFEDHFFSALLFFSYINGTDYNINLTSYFENQENTDNDDDDIIIPFPYELQIDNNIFGYQIVQRIKIISIPNEIILYCKGKYNQKAKLKEGDETLFSIDFIISPKKDVLKNDCTYFFEYQVQTSDLDYEEFNKFSYKIYDYPENSSVDQRDEFYENIQIYYGKILKIEFKLCHENCKSCKSIGKSKNLTKCEECRDNYKFFLDESTNTKTCFPYEDNCPAEFPFINIDNALKCESICEYEDILNDKCFIINSTFEALNKAYNAFTDIISNKYNNEDIVIKGDDNITFQLSNTLNEKEKLYKGNKKSSNLSIIDLGDCESKLKKINNIPDSNSLIILKFEKYYENSTTKNVQYEIYNPINLQKITDLSVCDDDKIDIYVPTNLDNKTLAIYENLKKKGYDIFNPNDTFYNDICTKYTSVNQTDLTLNDRRNIFYTEQNFCQENCQYNGINLEIMHAKCECSLQTTEIDYESKEFIGFEIISSFYEVLKYSNIHILKCYKILFSLIGIQNNYGFIIMIIFIILLIIFAILFLFTGIKTIREQMIEMTYNESLKEANNASQIKENNLNINKLKKETSPFKQKKRKNKTLHKTLKLNRISNNLNINLSNPKSKFKKKKKSVNMNNSSKRMIGSVKYSLNLNMKESMLSSKKFKRELIHNIYNDKNKVKIKRYSDFELDDLDYEEAIIYDKRSFINFYICLLKREHIIIFTFFYCKDFNLISIKLSLFVFSISLDMATNILFFDDESMHKIYLDYGKYNFISQIPQIVYSTLISESMDTFLKYLSLSEKEIYEVKKYKNIKEITDGIKLLIKRLKIKFLLFFVICFIFMIFFWYFISIFCAIYENTQIILFKDSSLSFLSSMLYPFGLYLLPATLRIISLRKKNKKILFKISNSIPLF